MTPAALRRPFPNGIHKWVRIPEAMDHVRLGWMPLDSLCGTYHGQFSVHCVWLCRCKLVIPKRAQESV